MARRVNPSQDAIVKGERELIALISGAARPPREHQRSPSTFSPRPGMPFGHDHPVCSPSFQAYRCRCAPGAREALRPLVFVLTFPVSPRTRRWRNVLGDAPMNRLNARLKEASDS